MISAGTVAREGLDPAMDSVAVGLAEHRVFFNPSEEPDSLFELLPELVDPRKSAEGRRFVALLRECCELNATQTGRGRAAAGFLDGLVTDLRDIELNRAEERGTMAGRAVAAAVRDPLRTLAGLDPDDLAAVVDAVRAVDRVLGSTPRAQALSREVQHQIGVRAFELLSELSHRRGGHA